jgi:hypothetical protein
MLTNTRQNETHPWRQPGVSYNSHAAKQRIESTQTIKNDKACLKTADLAQGGTELSDPTKLECEPVLRLATCHQPRVGCASLSEYVGTGF